MYYPMPIALWDLKTHRPGILTHLDRSASGRVIRNGSQSVIAWIILSKLHIFCPKVTQHSAFEGHLRGSVISNFHDVAGFYMLVGGFSEGIGPQLP